MSYPYQPQGYYPHQQQTTTTTYTTTGGVYQQPYQQTVVVQQGVQGWLSYYYNMLTPYEIQSLRLWFDSVDRDRSGTIEAHELQHLQFENRPIGIVCAIKMIKVFDKDRNGRIDFFEYCAMHKFILVIRQAFVVADVDRSGRLTANEIHTAMVASGFPYLTVNTVNELLNVFDPARQGLPWENFLMLSGHIAHARSVFEWNDLDRDGWIKLDQDQLIQISAYLH